MHPYVEILGHTFQLYHLINAFITLPLGALYLYFGFKSFGLKKLQIFYFFLIGYFAEYFGGWVVPLFYRMVLLGQKEWIYAWDKAPGRYFHSVVFFYLLYVVVFCKLWRWPLWKVLDRWIITISMASAMNRVGCLLQGCCPGKPTDLPWAIHLPVYQPEIARHPTQIYMIILETALTFFLWRFSKKKKYDGHVFWVGILAYSVYRYLIEYFRVNPVAYFGLTHAQLFSILCVELALGVLIYNRRQHP